MDINEIKDSMGITTLNLDFAEDKDGNKTEWLRHWDNDKRVAVSIHKETFDKVVNDDPSTLSVQSEIRTGNKGDYKALRIVLHTPAEFTL